MSQNSPNTSIMALNSIQPQRQTKGQRILDEVRVYRGVTSFELVNILGWPKATITARLNDLQRAGCIQPLHSVLGEPVYRYCPKTKAAHTVYEVTGKAFVRPPKSVPIKEQLSVYKAFYEAYADWELATGWEAMQAKRTLEEKSMECHALAMQEGEE